MTTTTMTTTTTTTTTGSEGTLGAVRLSSARDAFSAMKKTTEQAAVCYF
jgi:hypothetical protein